MSVVVMVRFPGDPAGLEQVAREDQGRMTRIVADARQHGLIHHRFVAGQDEMLAIDEWPSSESFQEFFAHQPDIPGLMRDAGVTGQPDVTVWRAMNVGDEV